VARVMTTVKKRKARALTPKQLQILKSLASGRLDFVNGAYAEHVTVGRPTRFERTLAALADRGLVQWSEDISEVKITPLGLEVSIDRAMARIGRLRGKRRPRVGSERAQELDALVAAVDVYAKHTDDPVAKLRASFARLVAENGGDAVDKMIDVACRKARQQTMKQIRAERVGSK